MDNGAELIDALTQVAKEKGIDKELIFEAIEASLVSASKKKLGAAADVRVTIDRKTGRYNVFAAKTVVETVTDPVTEIALSEARAVNANVSAEDRIEVVVTPGDFGRIAAQTAKQVVVQKFREAERDVLFKEYSEKERAMVTAVVQRRDRKNVIVSLGRLDAILPQNEQIPRENYGFQDRVKVYVCEVKQSAKGPQVTVSRSHPELVRLLFEQEVPEVYDGVVEIKAVAREAGSRSKVSVHSKNPNVDPVGSCVGPNGYRVNTVSRELRGEKMDIIPFNPDPVKYIAAALSPAKVITVAISPYQNDFSARVIVPDDKLSLAIGREGQNARLAARLTGWRIDIRSESQARDTDFLMFPEYETEEGNYYESDYYTEYDDDEYAEGEYDDGYEYYEADSADTVPAESGNEA